MIPEFLGADRRALTDCSHKAVEAGERHSRAGRLTDFARASEAHVMAF